MSGVKFKNRAFPVDWKAAFWLEREKTKVRVTGDFIRPQRGSSASIGKESLRDKVRLPESSV